MFRFSLSSGSGSLAAHRWARQRTQSGATGQGRRTSDAALDFMMFGDQFADQIMAHFGVPDGAIPIPIHLPIAAMDALDGPGGLGQHIATAVAAAAAGEAGPVALGPPNCAIM